MEAGDISMKYFGMLEENDIEFKNPVNLVTKVDKEIEDFLRMELEKLYPDVRFFGEEGSYGDLASLDRVFIVDPLDGTTNYVHRHPFFSVSVAYRENGVTKYGVVYAPLLKTLYFAEKGGGCFCDGKQVHVSTTDTLIDSLIGTGFACVRGRIKPDNVAAFSRIIYKARGVRRIGSAAIDLAYIADGRFDLFWEMFLYPWDMAAGALLIEEAGGMVTDIDGGPNWEENHRIVASNGRIHEEFLHELEKVNMKTGNNPLDDDNDPVRLA